MKHLQHPTSRVAIGTAPVIAVGVYLLDASPAALVAAGAWAATVIVGVRQVAAARS